MENPRTRKSSPVGVLLYAATAGKTELLASMLEEGVEVNAPGRKGMTALHWAASAGQLECVEFLLQRGAAVNARTRVGITPLMEAVCNGHLDVIIMLLAAAADVNLRTEEVPQAYWRAGRTALGMARNSTYLPKLEAGQRQKEIAALLEQAGAVE